MEVSYSLGDAIDWKRIDSHDRRIPSIILLLARGRDRLETVSHSKNLHRNNPISYSLGDAIDWKHSCLIRSLSLAVVSYSLGDAIDWKLH